MPLSLTQWLKACGMNNIYFNLDLNLIALSCRKPYTITPTDVTTPEWREQMVLMVFWFSDD